MKRIFLVLALALMLLAGNFGQALAAELVVDDEGDDHPWGGSSNTGDQPQYRHTEANVGVLSFNIFFIDVILTDRFVLHELRDETVFNVKLNDRYQEDAAEITRNSTSQTSLR